MLHVARTSSPGALVDALADLAATLGQRAGDATPGPVLEAACSRAKECLSRLRRHLYEERVFERALEETSSASGRISRMIGDSRRILGRLGHSLCGQLRRKDLPGVRNTTRTFVAFVLDSRTRHQRILLAAVRGMDAPSARRFADALFGRLLVDLVGREDAAARLQSAYACLSDRLGVRAPDSPLLRGES